MPDEVHCGNPPGTRAGKDIPPHRVSSTMARLEMSPPLKMGQETLFACVSGRGKKINS